MPPLPSRPPRDEKIPLDVLRRVMPKVDVVDLVPRDPTLLETLVNGFYDEVSTGDVSSRIKDDGKRR